MYVLEISFLVKLVHTGQVFLSLWYIVVMFLGWAYTCNLRAFIMLPGHNSILIDSDDDVINYIERPCFPVYRDSFMWTDRDLCI